MKKETLSVYWKVLLLIVFSIFIVSYSFILARDLSLVKKFALYAFSAFYLVSISIYLVDILVEPLLKVKDGLKKIADGNFNFQLYQKERDKFLEEFISDFNKVLVTLREYKEKQDVMGKIKSDFVSIAAHQFRRPVTEMRWILKMILDGEAGELTKKQKELLEQADRDNESINFLIDDLLNLSKIEEEASGYKLSKQNIENLIQEVINDLKFAASQKEIEIVFEKPKEALPEAEVDSTKIKLVIYNLIDNSIKYSYNKGKIIVEAKKENNNIKVSVQDSGIGVSKNEQKYIFEKFFRASNAKEKENVGTGLGLYIVRSIVERHGGSVGMTSEANKGSTFWFAIPIK